MRLYPVSSCREISDAGSVVYCTSAVLVNLLFTLFAFSPGGLLGSLWSQNKHTAN